MSQKYLLIFAGSSPGECWAFRGSEGSVVINLSNAIHVKAITLEHIPLSLAPDGSISSAPKSFQVFGLNSLDDERPVNLVSGLFALNFCAVGSFRKVLSKI